MVNFFDILKSVWFCKTELSVPHAHAPPRVQLQILRVSEAATRSSPVNIMTPSSQFMHFLKAELATRWRFKGIKFMSAILQFYLPKKFYWSGDHMIVITVGGKKPWIFWDTQQMWPANIVNFLHFFFKINITYQLSKVQVISVLMSTNYQCVPNW